MRALGLERLCFSLEDKGGYRTVDVRTFRRPRGMPGLFYQLLMISAHPLIFRGMAKQIARLAKQNTDQSTKPTLFFHVSHCIMGEITEECARCFLNNSGLI